MKNVKMLVTIALVSFGTVTHAQLKDKLAGLNESGMRNLQMTLLNNYLNGYTDRLSLMN